MLPCHQFLIIWIAVSVHSQRVWVADTIEFALTAPNGPCSGNHELTWHNYQDECSVPKTQCLQKLRPCWLNVHYINLGRFHPSLGATGKPKNQGWTKTICLMLLTAEMSGPWPLDQLGRNPTPPRQALPLNKNPKFMCWMLSSFGQNSWCFFASASIPRNGKLKTSLGHHSLAQPDPSRTSGSNLSLPAAAQVTIMEPSYSLSKFKTWHAMHAMPLPQVRWRLPKDHRMPVTWEIHLPPPPFAASGPCDSLSQAAVEGFRRLSNPANGVHPLVCVSPGPRNINHQLTISCLWGGSQFWDIPVRWRVEHSPPNLNALRQSLHLGLTFQCYTARIKA